MKTKSNFEVDNKSRSIFENAMNGHNAVDNISKINDNSYLIQRTESRSDLKIFVADIYIAGEADIYEINPNLFSCDCIVLIGFFNSYSNEAKEVAKDVSVGLFDLREFFGAVNCNGRAFLNYERKEKD